MTARYSHVRLDDLAGGVDKLPPTLGVGALPAYIPLTFAADSRGVLPMTPDGEGAGGRSGAGERNPNPARAIGGG